VVNKKTYKASKEREGGGMDRHGSVGRTVIRAKGNEW
jgi:hypothetical protein